MASARTLEILCWYTKLMNHLNIFPFVFVLRKESTFTVHHYYAGSPGSKKCTRNMRWSLAVQTILNSYMILQTYFNYVDIPSMIQSASLAFMFSILFSTQVMWWKQMDSLVRLMKNFLELNAELGMLDNSTIIL
jgi:hypothetical protein